MQRLLDKDLAPAVEEAAISGDVAVMLPGGEVVGRVVSRGERLMPHRQHTELLLACSILLHVNNQNR